jgi:hypothetical protein
MDVYDVAPTPDAPIVAEISRNEIINLTTKMDKGPYHSTRPPIWITRAPPAFP